MEDAATAEISRTQVWQWIKYGATLENGAVVTADIVSKLIDDEMAKLRDALGAEIYDSGRFPEAIDLFRQLSISAELKPFLTLPAYKLIA
jgi:malate synthase